MMNNICNHDNIGLGSTLVMSIVLLAWLIHQILQIKHWFRFKIDWVDIKEGFKTLSIILVVLTSGVLILGGLLWLIGWLIKLVLC